MDESKEAVRKVSADLGMAYVDLPCHDSFVYGDALRWIWNKHDLILCEHDIVPTTEQINELVQCSHLICTFAYKQETLDNKVVWAHRKLQDRSKLVHIKFMDQFCDMPALGLIRIRKRAQKLITIPPRLEMVEIEELLGIHIRNLIRTHVHWPPIARFVKTNVYN